MANLDNRSDQNIGAALQRVTDNLTGLVHDEIALAKAEVSEKVSKLLKGAVVAVIAGVFFFFGLFVLLEGFAWLAYYAIPFPKGTIFFGFFAVAALVFAVGGCAGFFAARAFKAGAPPTPDAALEEAKATKSAVSEAWQGGQEKQEKVEQDSFGQNSDHTQEGSK